MRLSSEASEALRAFYDNYLQDIKNGKEPDKASHIGDNFLIPFVKKVGYNNAVKICKELSMYGLLSYMKADNTIYWAKIEEKGISYIEERA